VCSVSLAGVEIRIDLVVLVCNGTQMESSQLTILLRLEIASFKAMNRFRGSLERRELGAFLDSCGSIVVGEV